MSNSISTETRAHTYINTFNSISHVTFLAVYTVRRNDRRIFEFINIYEQNNGNFIFDGGFFEDATIFIAPFYF